MNVLTNCIICGEPTEIAGTVTVCSKCKEAVMSVRARNEFFQKAFEESRSRMRVVAVNEKKETDND